MAHRTNLPASSAAGPWEALVLDVERPAPRHAEQSGLQDLFDAVAESVNDSVGDTDIQVTALIVWRTQDNRCIPATFIYAGINVEKAGLFSGVRGSQIAGRFTMIPTTPFPRTAEWNSLIATIENALRLHRHRPGSLLELTDYLHQRTAGMIGSLSHLVRGAALDAILTGGEKITKKLLDAVELDHAAQNRTRGRPATRA